MQFSVGFSLDRELANKLRPTTCIQRTTTCVNANYQSWVLSHGEAGAPRHTHVQLEGQFRSLVHTLCVWQGPQWSWVECHIASDNHISYIYIYIYATAIFIFNFITAQTSGHNFGPDALARKQCRARVLAALGRALCAGRGAVRTGPFRRAPATTPSPSEPGPSLHLRPLRRYSSGARGTSTAARAGALGASVNEQK
jgi:hypothetical protein